MKISNTQTFELDQVYDLTELAKIIGNKVGGKFVADTTNEPLNGYLTQQIFTNPDGTQKSLVTVYFYENDEKEFAPEPVNETDPEEVKALKRRQRNFAHTNPFRKLHKTKSLEVSIESEIKKIKNGKLKIRSIKSEE